MGDGEMKALIVAGVGGGGALLEAKSSTMHHPLLQQSLSAAIS